MVYHFLVYKIIKFVETYKRAIRVIFGRLTQICCELNYCIVHWLHETQSYLDQTISSTFKICRNVDFNFLDMGYG